MYCLGLGMVKLFHSRSYNGYNYWWIGIRLIHVIEYRGLCRRDCDLRAMRDISVVNRHTFLYTGSESNSPHAYTFGVWNLAYIWRSLIVFPWGQMWPSHVYKVHLNRILVSITTICRPVTNVLNISDKLDVWNCVNVRFALCVLSLCTFHMPLQLLDPQSEY